MIQWFPMQVNPEQEQPVRQALERYGMESFQTSMVPGLIFVHSSREWLTTLKNTDSALFSLRFMNIHQKERPGGMAVTTICDREMENFIKAETLSDPDQQRIALTWTDFLGQDASSLRSSARRRLPWASPTSLPLRWSSFNPYPQDPRPDRRVYDILL